MFFIYIIECKDGSYYIGQTNNLLQRMVQHKNGNGCLYTKNKGFNQLLVYWVCDNRNGALKLEKYLKTLTKKRKITLIENPELLGKKFGVYLDENYKTYKELN